MERHGQHHMAKNERHYLKLGLMTGLSFLAMYALMYAMVNRFANVHNSWNQAYMAALMTAPMVIFEILLMGSMYGNKRANLLIVGASALAVVAAFFAIRIQAGISDKQFLRSMIPHHASALLMCEHASLRDPEIKALCERLKASQQSEIDLMEAKLRELER